MDLNKLKQKFVFNLNTFLTLSLNLKAKKFKSNINHQRLNIATYGQAYSCNKYIIYNLPSPTKRNPKNHNIAENMTYNL